MLICGYQQLTPKQLLTSHIYNFSIYRKSMFKQNIFFLLAKKKRPYMQRPFEFCKFIFQNLLNNFQHLF